MKSIEEYPQCIVSTGSDGKFLVDETVLNELKSIDSPVVVIGITGKYRTGKSYLLNRIAGVQKGFAIGRTIESVTKGLWIWVRKHPEKDGVKLVLIDTEGLGDAKKGDVEHDNMIFILATLLSSILIHNVLGMVDKETITNLSCFTELSKRLTIGEFNSDEVPSPMFILTARDFTLDLTLNGKELTPDEFLENLLETKTVDEATQQCPCESIKAFFPKRKCFIFDRPASRNELGILDQLDDDKLSKSFREDTEAFLKYIYEISDASLAHGSDKPLTASVIAGLMGHYVDGINKGDLPSVETTMTAVIKRENEELVGKSVDHYRKHLSMRIQLPFETITDLEKVDKVLRQECEDLFSKRCFGNEKVRKGFLSSMEKSIDEQYAAFKEKSEGISKEKCEQWLKEAQQKLIGKVTGGDYQKSMGYKQYLEDLAALEKKYNQTPLGTMRNYVWRQYEPILADYATKLQWAEIDSVFMPWLQKRKDTINALKEIVGGIEEVERTYRRRRTNTSSVGIGSVGLFVAGIVAAPFTAGLSAGLAISGVGLGVASGVTGFYLDISKRRQIASGIEKAKALLGEDNKLYKSLKEKLKDLVDLSHERGINGEGERSSNTFRNAAGAFARAAVGIADTLADFAKIGGAVTGATLAVSAVLDAITIKQNATCEESEIVGELKECIDRLEKSLETINTWYDENSPPKDTKESLG